MLLYTVKPGDMLGVLTVKYKTTIRILMMDNPFIPETQKLEPGWKLKIYTPEENAIRHSNVASNHMDTAHQLKQEIQNNNHLLYKPRDPVFYKEREVLEGQMAFAKILKETPLLEIQANGYQKTIRLLPVGEILRVYEKAELNGEQALIVDGLRWIIMEPDNVFYDEIPPYNLDGKIRIPPKMMKTLAVDESGEGGGTINPPVSPKAFVGYGEKPSSTAYQIAPTSFVGSGAVSTVKTTNTGVSNIPEYQYPGYRRPVMTLKNAAGQSTTIELRVLGFNASYSNNVQPATTNAGWMINIRAHSLPVLTISGFLLETRANNEFNDFMQRYRKYLMAQKTDDYYSLGVSTLFFKNTEYKGIVVSFTYSDNSEQTLHRKYTMQMLVLKEKSITGEGLAKIPTVVNRNNMTERAFRSNIGSMLANTITGHYTN